MGNFIVGIILIGIVSFVIYNLYIKKKNRKASQCGDCSHCGGGCH